MQERDNLEEISRLRITFRAKLTHEALWRFVRKAAQLFKADSGVDVIAQNGLASLELVIPSSSNLPIHYLSPGGLNPRNWGIK